MPTLEGLVGSENAEGGDAVEDPLGWNAEPCFGVLRHQPLVAHNDIERHEGRRCAVEARSGYSQLLGVALVHLCAMMLMQYRISLVPCRQRA